MNKKGWIVISVQFAISAVMLVLILLSSEIMTPGELTMYMSAYLIWTAVLVGVVMATDLVVDKIDD